MCVAPDSPKVANIVTKPSEAPEKAPDPVPINTNADDKKRKGRSSLRIDLASGGPASGVNV
ncbi:MULTISPECIES: hypothetical protein [unclassified Mesorhizobium]|uniref:hypothetical protein n=1 Tax=unclassified Mesorhizobium TaxID=325217 RepID=UPI000FCA1594|nr:MULTISPECIES: hypothetical protein [unclassified Mesorhizobium]RUT86782.1 hypothetical protein EOD15_24580 [Mesorhizobium sp. M7A.T.Ca.US.000.02.2.1]RUT87627.1 hypothetical protein EOD14_09520 [Mesorhizobium sp. M7A.T.Ca.US.000.02.1.1]